MLRLQIHWRMSDSYPIYVNVWKRPESDLTISDSCFFLLTCSCYRSDGGTREEKRKNLNWVTGAMSCKSGLPDTVQNSFLYNYYTLFPSRSRLVHLMLSSPVCLLSRHIALDKTSHSNLMPLCFKYCPLCFRAHPQTYESPQASPDTEKDCIYLLQHVKIINHCQLPTKPPPQKRFPPSHSLPSDGFIRSAKAGGDVCIDSRHQM